METDNLTPEQKKGVELAANFLVDKARAVTHEEIGKLTILTQKDVDAAIQKGINEIVLANSPLVTEVRAAREAKFKGEYLNALITQFRGHPEVLEKLWAEYPEMWPDNNPASPAGRLNGQAIERAVLVSGATTYSNVTPQTMFNEILTYQKIGVWHRQYCRVFPNAGRSGIFPLGTATRGIAYRNTEGVAPTDSAPTMGADTYTCIPLSYGLPISNELLNQWSIAALRPWITDEMGYAVLLKEFTEFIVGTNSTQWNGIETAITGATYDTGSGDSDYRTCRKLYRGLPMFYRDLAVFFATSETFATLESLKDPAGHFILDVTQPVEKLFGKPILEIGSAAGATDNRLNFGALSKYHIYENGSVMTVDNVGFTNTSTNSTYFHFSTNNDAGPADLQAFRYCSLAGA